MKNGLRMKSENQNQKTIPKATKVRKNIFALTLTLISIYLFNCHLTVKLVKTKYNKLKISSVKKCFKRTFLISTFTC